MKNRKRNTQNTTIPRNVKKVFAVTACIYTALDQFETLDLDQQKLIVQCDRAMKVFSNQVGERFYTEMADEIKRIWRLMLERYDSVLTIEEFPVFIEWLAMLVYPKDYSEFLGKLEPYTTTVKLKEENRIVLANCILGLDEELNSLFGTKPCIFMKPKEKVEKTKKPRDKSKKKPSPAKKQKNRNKVKASERRINAKKFLSERIKKIREDMESKESLNIGD